MADLFFFSDVFLQSSTVYSFYLWISFDRFRKDPKVSDERIILRNIPIEKLEFSLQQQVTSQLVLP